MFDIFRFSNFFNRGGLPKINNLIIHQNNIIFSFVQLSHLSSFFIFFVLVIIYIMVKNIGCSYKYNRPEKYTPKFTKPVLSSSSAHTLYASNLTGTSISSQPDNKDITTNQNKNNTSNTYYIHSCVTPQRQITVSSPHLHPLV